MEIIELTKFRNYRRRHQPGRQCPRASQPANGAGVASGRRKEHLLPVGHCDSSFSRHFDSCQLTIAFFRCFFLCLKSPFCSSLRIINDSRMGAQWFDRDMSCRFSVTAHLWRILFLLLLTTIVFYTFRGKFYLKREPFRFYSRFGTAVVIHCSRLLEFT